MATNACVMIHNKNKIHKCEDNFENCHKHYHTDKRASEFFHHQLTIEDANRRQRLKNSQLNFKCQQQPQINACMTARIHSGMQIINVTSSCQ